MFRFWWAIPGKRRVQLMVAGVALAALFAYLGSEVHREGIVSAKGVDSAGTPFTGQADLAEWSWFKLPWMRVAEASWASPAGVRTPMGPIAFSKRTSTGAPGLFGFSLLTSDDAQRRHAMLEDALAAAGASPAMTITSNRVVWVGLLARTLAPVLGAGAIVLAFAKVYDEGRRSRGATRCAACEYPLIPRTDGVPGMYCPECGERSA